MGELFPGVPKQKRSPQDIAKENPSIWLGFLPVIGGAITTPLQLREIATANQRRDAATHFAKLLAINSVKRQGMPNERQTNVGGAGQVTRVTVAFQEPARIADAVKQRIAVEQRLRSAAVSRFNAQSRPRLLEQRRPMPAITARVLQLRPALLSPRFEGQLKFNRANVPRQEARKPLQRRAA